MSYSFTDFFQMLVLQAQNWSQIWQVQYNNNNYYNNDNNNNNNNNNNIRITKMTMIMIIKNVTSC